MGVLSTVIGGASAAGGLLQPIVGASAAAKDRAWQEKMMDKQMSYNQQMYQQQMSDTWKLYEDQKQYNSATEQRKRLEDAGLNPYLMMSGGSAGSVGSQSVASAQGVSQPGLSPRPGIAGLGQGLAQAAELFADLDIKNEQAKQLRVENKYREQQIVENLMNIRSRTRNERVKTDIDVMLASFQKDLLKAQTGKTQTESLMLGIQAQAAAYDALSKHEQLKMLPAQLQADLAYRLGEIALQKQQGQLNEKELDKKLQEINGLILDNNQKIMNQAEQSDTYNMRYNTSLATLRKIVTDINVADTHAGIMLQPIMSLINSLGKTTHALDSGAFEHNYKPMD